jgi:hypothetical protein
MSVQDLDGKRIAFGEGNQHPEVLPGAPPGWKVNSIMTTSFPLPLPAYGDYSLEVVVNGNLLKSAQFRAVPLAVTAPQGQDPNYVI